jgi:hypothetical protein
MAFGTYNNNDKQPVNVTYSAVGFSNPTGTVAQSKLNISYFNKLLKIGIANKNPSNNNGYDTYDNDNQASVYVSCTKARIIRDMIKIFIDGDHKEDMKNVAVELKNGLLMLSDGSEFGVDCYCIVIKAVDDTGNVLTSIYQIKNDYYEGIYNYYDDKADDYCKYTLSNLELDSFICVLDEYIKASTYAVAATVMEASMYKRNAATEVLYNIGRKVGVVSEKGNGNGGNGSFLNRNNNNNGNHSNSLPNGVDSKDYEVSSFEELAGSMK